MHKHSLLEQWLLYGSDPKNRLLYIRREDYTARGLNAVEVQTSQDKSISMGILYVDKRDEF